MITVLEIATPRLLWTATEYDIAVAEVDRLVALDPQPGSEERLGIPVDLLL